MKKCVLLLTMLIVLTVAKNVFAQGTAFTYQGQLQNNGGSAGGNYDFTFALFNNSSTNTGQVGSTLTKLDVGVTNGLFTVVLDFGANFPGASRWLAIGVRTNGGSSFTALSPLQPLTPTPYAIYAPSAGSASSANSVAATNITGTILLSQLPAALVTNTEAGVTLSNLTLNGALTLPAITPSKSAVIYSGTNLLLYADDNDDFFSGRNAGNPATSGGANTAVGSDALGLGTSGGGNTAVGAYALANTSGADNTAVGLCALQFNTGGGYNTANGAFALEANTADENTAVGWGALAGNTNGDSSTAVGTFALEANTSGNGNTAVGWAALSLNMSGSYNTAQGDSSLANLGNDGNGGGSSNIALGNLAGYNFTGSESGNIDIGNQGVAGENNTIRIGDPSVHTNTFLAGVINGNGGRLTNLAAANLTGNLPAISGANLTSLNASQLVNGAIPLARLPAAVVTNNNATSVTLSGAFNGNGGGLTNLMASQLLGGANNNLFIGTLAASTSGAANTAFGDGALNDIFDGGDNTAVGFQALYNTTSGSYNTALGENALYRLGTTGSSFGGTNNLALGYQAGLNYTGNESSNIDIGSLGVAGENYVIRIGSSQSQTHIAGVINGNGGGLTNLNAMQLSGSIPGGVSVPATNLTGTISRVQLPAAVVTNTEMGVTLSGTFSGNGNGLTNLDASQLAGTIPNNVLSGFQGNANAIGGGQGNNATGGLWATIGGGNNNTNSGNAGTIGGGQNNTVSNNYQPTVGGGYANTAANNYATVAGGYGNNASGPGAFIGGGGFDGNFPGPGNDASGTTSVISGGEGNTNSGFGGAIAGGLDNYAGNFNQPTVGGGYNNSASNHYATIAGGNGNTASGQYSSIGGGSNNLASGQWATVGGGLNNQANNNNCAVPGGANNIASGLSCFAAGLNAQAINNHSFVWSDGSATTTSFASDQFMARASGGVVFQTSSAASPTSYATGSAGVALLANATSWTTISDRNAKKNFQPVDTKAVLDKLAAIPIQQWNYKWEKDGEVPNIGPMAQDFKHAFYPGRDDKGITTLEFDGVELAAIQALNQKLDGEAKAKDVEIKNLKRQNDLLAERLNELEAAVKQLAAQK